MSTPASVKAQLQELIAKANTKTGRSDTDLTVAVDALIAGYGAESGGGETACSHADVTITYEYNGDGTHRKVRTCSFCGETVSEVTEDCDTVEGNFLNNDDDNDHTFDTICKNCGGVVTTGEMGAHVDENDDGLCDLCGGCIHEYGEDVYTDNGDGTHHIKCACIKCGYIDFNEDADHVDKDGDGACDYCGAAMQTQCSHENRSSAYTFNGDGTHITKVTCGDCGATVSETTVACTDDDGDGVCDVCHGELETQADDAVWVYAAGELNGVYKYEFSIKDGALRCIEPDGSTQGVAVGKMGGASTSQQTSGQKVLPVPIPKTASKMTFTAGSDYASGVEVLFFKGQPNAVESYETQQTEQGAMYLEKTAAFTFVAGAFDYLVLNVSQSSSSSVAAPQVGTRGTLVFE